MNAKQSSDTFACWQALYAAHGIPTFPVVFDGSPPDKRPAVRGWKGLGLNASRQLALRFAEAEGIGFACGRQSRIVVLDIDTPDERVRDGAFARHGEPVIATRTLSGGFHGWYRWTGETRRTRPEPSRPIDILGAGPAVAPPSRCPGRDTGYEFIQGDLDDLDRLTPLYNLPGELPIPGLERRHSAPRRWVSEGERNDALWRWCMRQARTCQDLEQLRAAAALYAESCIDRTGTTHAFTEAEIDSCARSAWKYEMDGCNLFGPDFSAPLISNGEIDVCLQHPDAAVLYLTLARYHDRRSEFAVANATARLFGWGKNRLCAAREYLVEQDILICTTPGGRGPNSPPRFIWKRHL